MTGGTKARMAVYDFKTMYTCIPLDDLADRMHKLIRKVYVLGVSGQPCLWLLQLSKSESRWVQSDQPKQDTRWLQIVDADRLCFNAVKTGHLYLYQARQGCVMPKNRHPNGH